MATSQADPDCPRSWPKVIGHRGAAKLAPENTLAGARAAAEAGAAMIEFDAKLSADGVAMVMHDDTVDRTTDGTGDFATLSLGRLRALDAGRSFSPVFAGEKVPTLAEMLVTCASLGLAVNIEIKPCPGRAEETARIVLETARSVWASRDPAPLISSFNRRCLSVARTIMPHWPIGVLLDQDASLSGHPDTETWGAFADRVAAATINIADRMATRDSIASFANGGRAVMVYTVNDPARARSLIAMGAASVITDSPDLLLGALEGDDPVA
jgi:glycerophosphoryl diester phosphodiesterase